MDKAAILQAQLQLAEARVLRSHAEITSGAYKQRLTEQMVKGGDFRPCTDEEKLAQRLGVMDNHIQFMQELVDALCEIQAESEKRMAEAREADAEFSESMRGP